MVGVLRRPGYTLVEVLVAGTVATLLLIACADLFICGIRLFATNQRRANLQATGLKPLQELALALRPSALDVVSVSPDQEMLAIRLPPWTNFATDVVLFYRDDEGHLVRKTCAPVDEHLELRPPPTKEAFKALRDQLWWQYRNVLDSRGRVEPTRKFYDEVLVRRLASGVKRVRFTDERNGAIGILLELEREDQLETETVETRVYLRNRL